MQLQTQPHQRMLRDLLTYRRTDLLAYIHAAETARRERSVDPTEVSDRKQESELARTLRAEDAQEARDRAELRLVDSALQRLDDGIYGHCVDCGARILYQRLLVQPAAERCAACQSAFEHRQP